MTESNGVLPVAVTLTPPLLAAVEPAAAAAGSRIESELGELMRELGIERGPEVRLEADGTRLIGLTVAGRACRFPQTLIAEALAYVDGTPQVAVDPGAAVAGQTDTDADRIVELLATVCRAAVSAQPAILDARSDEPDTADTIDIDIDPAHLREISADEPDRERFRLARDGLFVELGLPLPPFHFRPDPSLRPAGFAFRVNRVRTLPRIGLPAGTILVNDAPDRLALFGVDAEPTTNPATYLDASLAPQEHKEALELAGFTTWDSYDYLVLCFAAALRSRAHALMTPDVAQRMLEQLKMAFPFLGAAADTHVPRDVLAPLLRELLLDGVPIRNLRRIVELLLRYETDDAPNGRPDRMAFVRSGLADTIAYTYARGTSTVVVYLLDPAIEDAVSEQGDEAANGELRDRLAAAVQAELAQLPRVAHHPALLTRDELRRPLRDLVRHEFPRLRVLAYGDLPPDYNVQPVARISWA